MEQAAVETKKENKKPRQDKQKKTENKEGGEKQQQQNGEKKEKKERKPREDKFDWDKTKVTLETEVPAAPKGKDKIVLPKKEQMEKKREIIQKKVDELYKQKRVFIENMIMKNKESKEEKYSGSKALRDTLKEQQKVKDEVQEQFNAIKTKFDAKKQEIEALFDESQIIRKKMKVVTSKPELERLIQEKEDQLNNETLTTSQEKKLITDLDQLKKSLPLAQKLYPLEEQIKQVTQEKKALGTEMHGIFPKLQESRDAIKSTIGDLEEIKNLTSQSKDSVEPLIQAKKEEINDQVEKLKKEQKEILTQFKEQQNAYYDQQELIRYVEWVRRQKEKLQRDANFKAREAEREARKQQEEEEEKEFEEKQANAAYQKDIDTCTVLIAFCRNQLALEQATKEEENQTKTGEVNLEAGEWKKENVTIVKNKRELQNDDFLSGQGGKKGKKHQKKQFVKEEGPRKIQLTLTDLNDFANMRVSAPKTIEDLAKAIEQLEEKKKYFESIPKEEKLQQLQKQQEEEKQDNKQVKTKKAPVELKEEEFPGL